MSADDHCLSSVSLLFYDFLKLLDRMRIESHHRLIHHDKLWIWQQAKADGIDFNIGKAAAEGIVLNSSVTLPQAEHIVIYVYDKNNRNVSIVIEKDKNTQTEQFVLTPKKMLIYDLSFEQELKYEEDIPENQFVSGEKYRVCCVVLDKDRNVIYRWHEYVTIQ